MISIIIPIYQCKWNLGQIVDDIVAQSYRDYEVLLVDDGSTDGSGEICQKYERENNKIRVILKEHSGVSETRNAGIVSARGEYIAFIDSDDRIEPDYLEKLVHGIGDSDLVISSFDRRFYKAGKCVRTVKNQALDTQIDVKENLSEYFSELYTSTLLGTPVCKLFKREIILEYAIRFRKDIYIGEDFIFNFDYLKHCVNIQCIDYTGYHYICNERESLTHKSDLKKFDYGKNLFAESVKFCREMNLPPKAETGVHNLYLRTCFLNMEVLYRTEKKLSHKQKMEFIRRVITDEDTQKALKQSIPDTKEFKIYRMVLKLGNPAVAGVFTWLRWQYKKMLGRA